MNISTVLSFLSYMAIYSFFGWIIESIYKSILEKQFVNSGFLKGPFCPIYGIAAIFIIITLSSLKDRIMLLFIVSVIMLSIWEYIVGVFLEKVFKQKYWDYSENKFNLHGRICLKNSIYWGILGVIFIQFVHPFISEKVSLIPIEILFYIILILYVIIISDTIITISNTVKFEKAVQKVNELGEKIKEVLEEIKQNANNATAVKVAENLMDELRHKQAKIKVKLYKEARRLKLAFPTMKSEKITKFLNEKIDFETLKKLIKNKE